MKKLFVCVFFAFYGLSVFAQQLPTVAVATFDMMGGVTQDEATVVTELFMTELVSKGTVNVVDRGNTDKILAEMHFQATEWSDRNKTAEVGQRLNAQYVIRGQLMKMGSVIYWTATMVDVNTAQVLYSAREQISDLGEIFGKLPAFCTQMLDKVPPPNYFVGRWKSTAGNKTEIEIEFLENGKLNITKYQIEVYDRVYSFTGSGIYAYTKDTISMTINLSGSIEYIWYSSNSAEYHTDESKDNFGPNISSTEKYSFIDSKTQFSTAGGLVASLVKRKGSHGATLSFWYRHWNFIRIQ
jgi:TolB-like protein